MHSVLLIQKVIIFILFEIKKISFLESQKNNCISSGSAWTIVLDVAAGMLLMISLLHMVDPGKYLMNFTEVNREGFHIQPFWTRNNTLFFSF